MLYAVYWEAVFELNRQSFAVGIAKTSAAFSGQQRQLSYLKAASFLLKCAGAAVCNICEYQMIGWFFLKLKAIHADRFFFAYL